MSNDTNSLIGKLLDEGQERDAIHIAVAPVVAATQLSAGMRVGFFPDGRVARLPQEVIGIVDPFLTETVHEGERFWLFLLPNTITSLKHNWTHPSFAAPTPDANKVASEAWLRNFCANADCPGYEEVIATAVGGGSEQWNADYLHFNGSNAHGEIPPEFWVHVENVTGRKIERRATNFSCSC